MLLVLARTAAAEPPAPPAAPPTYAFTEPVPIRPKPPAPGQAIVLLRQELHGKYEAQLDARLEGEIAKMAEEGVP